MQPHLLMNWSDIIYNAEQRKYDFTDVNHFLGTPEARRGFLIAFTLLMCQLFSLSPVLTVYASKIFQDSGSDLDPNISTIIMGTIQLIGSLLAIIFVDHIGRRILLVLSSTGCTIGLFTMGLYGFIGNMGYDIGPLGWISVASLSLILFSVSSGLVPLSFVVIVEVLPPKV